MFDTVKVMIDGFEEEIEKGTTLEELSKKYCVNRKYPIILARVNNRIRELNYPVVRNKNIDFLDWTSASGNKAYINGLLFLLSYAVKELYGNNAEIYVLHSIDKGIYIEANFKLNEEVLKIIEEKMRQIVSFDMKITKVEVDKNDAINYFTSMNDLVKVNVMRYVTSTTVTLYRLGDLYDYFYYHMPISTGCLTSFEFTYLNEKGFVLRFPTIYIPDRIKEYRHSADIFSIFREIKDSNRLMGINTLADLNNIISNSKANDLIRVSEIMQNNKLCELVKSIYDKRDKIKIVLIAGPSSSGKTTTSRKLCLLFKSFGMKPITISMDDYFVERSETPVNEKGEADFECLEAVDLDLFDKQVSELLEGKEVVAPTYNFIYGKKEFNNKIKLDNNSIIIIEGIHALNDKVLSSIKNDVKFKIYLSALSELNIDNHNKISTTDHRLLRRIIRDNRTRGYNVDDTLKLWPKVREGEEKYIFPFQYNPDVTFNTALVYEIGVLKTYVEPLLYSVDNDSEYYEEAKRLLNFLRNFLPIPTDAIPQDSILREFIGGSCFHD